MELKTITCPNCGATTTNPNNCEFCGSLLVRFADKGIDLSQTSYLNNGKVIPGLIPELKKNLMLQKTTDEIVITDIYLRFPDGSSVSELNVIRSGYANWENSYSPDFLGEKPILLNNSKHGLVIVFSFREQEGERSWTHDIFKSLPSYSLYTQHVEIDNDEDPFLGRKVRYTYAIDFGEDAEGAARLISEYLEIKDQQYHQTDGWFYATNVGLNNITQNRDMFDDENMRIFEKYENELVYEEEEEDETDWGNVLKWTLYILGIIIYLIYLMI